MNRKKWRQKHAYKDSRRWLKSHPPHYSALHGRPKNEKFVRDLMEEYPMMEREYRTYQHSQAYTIRGGGPLHNYKRIEDILEPPRSWKWRGMLAVREAKGITVHLLHRGHTALKLINLIYWPKPGVDPMRLSEAAKALSLTWNQACTLHDGFLRLVEKRYKLKKGDVW